MQAFSTKIGGKKISCVALGTLDHIDLDLRVSKIFAKALKGALGKSVPDAFKEGIAPSGDEDGEDSQRGLSAIVSAIMGVAEARLATNEEDFKELLQDCISHCRLEGEKTSEKLSVNDLNPLEREHYVVMAWFLECQLGNFTGWKSLKNYMIRASKALLNIKKEK